MSTDGHLDSLSDDDQLSLWMGRVARVHASLEFSLTNVHEALTHGSETVSAPHNVRQLIDECRHLLRSGAYVEPLPTAGILALRAAGEATHARNRVVHDLWLDAAGADGADDVHWAIFRRDRDARPAYGSGTPGRLGSVIEAHDEVVRARHRVSGLFMALYQVGGMSISPQPAGTSNMPLYLALMENRFTFDEIGSYVIADAPS